jgi:O-antigen/teichoic acid export membrane protein
MENGKLATEDSTVDTSAEPVQGAFRKWLPWLTKGSLAIADQGVFAVSNFLLNVLLVRWLSPADYGAFALAYSIFLSLLLMHNALLTTPMLVFGQGKYRERFPEYLGVLLRAHVALMVPAAVLLVVGAFVVRRFYSPLVASALLALAAAAPVILLLWVLRRAFYARLDPIWAAASGVVYLVILVAVTVALHVHGLLSPATGLLSMAAASFITCALLLVRLRPVFRTDAATMRAVAKDHWDYGKWVAAGAGPNWITDNIYYIVLPARLGLAQAGALKALLNLAQPASQSISALGVLLMPILVRDRQTGGAEGMAKTIRMSTVLLVAGSAAYIALLWVFRAQVFHSLYGSKFAGFDGWPLLAAGLIPLAQALPNVAGAALGAIEKPELGFHADSWSAGFAVLVGIPLAFWVGVGGALLGIALTYALMGVLTLLFYQRALRKGDLMTSAAAVPGPPSWTEAS